MLSNMPQYVPPYGLRPYDRRRKEDNERKRRKNNDKTQYIEIEIQANIGIKSKINTKMKYKNLKDKVKK